MIQILADSTCDLSDDLIDQYHIKIIPLYVNIGGKTFRDGVDISQAQLFSLVSLYGELPKTSAPSIQDFVQAFCPGEDNLYISISSMLSSSNQDAQLAAQSIENAHIDVFDSLNITTGIGLLILKAAEMRDRGASIEEIHRALLADRGKIRTILILETLEYVYMGGRCSAIQNIVGSLLKLRPVLIVKPDGTLGIKAKIRGRREKALQYLLDTFKSDLSNIDRHRVFITHTASQEDAEYLAAEIKKMASIDEILITYAGSVISSHCGPKTIGIIYQEC